MRQSKRRADTRDDDQPDAAGPKDLEAELDQLALQIVRQATRKDPTGDPVEPLPLQLQALKTAGGYFALKRKHSPGDDGEGSAWGGLMMNGAALRASALGGDDDEEEEEELDG